MLKVFISYSSSDSVFADLLKMKLEKSEITTWIDRNELKAGEVWRDAIDIGISTAQAIIVILSPESCNSPYVTYEWGFALGKGVKVIPILLENCEIHPRLNVLQYLDFQDKKNLPWDKLTSQIPKKISSQEDVYDIFAKTLIKNVSSSFTLEDLYTAFSDLNSSDPKEAENQHLIDIRSKVISMVRESKLVIERNDNGKLSFTKI